ncbi:hypothetical protein [Namhaeicola litoreus]|uniref:Uncharacterized protein n=1 Tax=Namhaeicola litoreus TaxID=1052145 RepID=A0ABW3Y2Y5_9FLAO
MASIQNLKKDLNIVLSDVIEECYVAQLTSDEKKAEKFEKIIDESIGVFDELIERINDKKVENRSKHLKEVKKDLELNANALLDKIGKLKE